MDAKAAAQERLDSLRSRIIELSHTIHANPEPGFKEAKAAGLDIRIAFGCGLRCDKREFVTFRPHSWQRRETVRCMSASAPSTMRCRR